MCIITVDYNILGYWFAHSFLFTLILWIISFIGKLFYTNKYFQFKFSFYECGFKSIKKYKTHYDINFVFVVLFLIIYDAEFIIFLPCALYFEVLSINACFIFIIFIFLLVFTLIIDTAYFALEWQGK